MTITEARRDSAVSRKTRSEAEAICENRQPQPVSDSAEMLALARDLLGTVLPDPRGVRLLGVTLSSLHDAASEPSQLELFR